MKRSTCKERDIKEETVAELRKKWDCDIVKYLPCKIVIHLPPPDGNDPVVFEITAKLR